MRRLLILCTTDSMIWNFLVYHIKLFQQKGYIVECACSKTGVYFDELKDVGLTMHRIEFSRAPFKFKNILAYNELNKLIKKNKYDIIFCHEPVGGAMGRLLGHKNQCKVVYMAHGFHFYKGAPFINNILFYRIERWLSSKTDLLITINNEDFRASMKFGAKTIEHLNGIGVDTTKFKSFKSNWLGTNAQTANKINLLSVGELIPRKNHKKIIEAISILKDPDIHYHIAGEGQLMEWLKKYAEKLGVKNQVHFLGFRRNTSELYNSCDIFILPSVQEGLSLALMEAMACSKPVIASRIRGNSDLIIENKGGILVDISDANGYAEAIVSLINQPELMKEMGKFNSKIIKEYDIKNIGDKLIKLMGEI